MIAYDEELFPCLLFPGAGATWGLLYLAFNYPGYFDSDRQTGWQKFADAAGFWFDPGDLFKPARVYGRFRGHKVKLDSFLKLVIVKPFSYSKQRLTAYIPFTRLTISLKPSDRRDLAPTLPTRPVLTEQLKAVVLPAIKLKGKCRPHKNILGIYYDQPEIETNEHELKLTLTILMDLADAYAAVQRFGSEIIPTLQEIAEMADDRLAPFALQLLYNIAQESATRYRPDLLCPTCLVRFGPHQLHLHDPNMTIRYYGCRLCGRNRDILQGRVTAVLDRAMKPALALEGETLAVNWLARRSLFDFDAVEIRAAADQEVEQFAIQAGNDTDPRRQPTYRRMTCRVARDCPLNENTLRVLQRIFGQVERF
jgi:hypothetical protein